MKGLFIVCAILIFCISPIYSEESDVLNLEVERLIEKLSQDYSHRYPGLVTKKAVLILEPEELSESAEKKDLGALILSYLQEKMPQSLVFYQVDRDNMETMVEEYKLALSGMLDESTLPDIGEGSAAAALIHGSVVEEGNSYRVTVSLTDLANAEMISTHSFSIPREDMEWAAENLQYEYVAKNGIGLSAGLVYFITQLENVTEPLPPLIDIGVKYRVSRNILIGGGTWILPISTGGFYRYDGDITFGDAQPDLITQAPGLAAEEIGQVTSRFKEVYFFHLDGQYTVNFSPKFNLGIKLSYIMSNNIRTNYAYSSNSGVYYLETNFDAAGNPTADTIHIDTRDIELVFDSLIGGKIELAPEFFITPRLAVNGTFGYIFTNKAKVKNAYASKGEWEYNEESIESGANYIADETYFGLDPSLLPTGEEWILDFSGFYGGLSISFFF